MEIRHEAKRQQIHKHLFAFDVLPQTNKVKTLLSLRKMGHSKMNTTEEGTVCV